MPDRPGPAPKLEHGHSPEEIRARLAAGPRSSYLRDWIYGGIDGAVTTFAIVAGAVGAQVSVDIVLILGVANLVADGFSMAAGNYSGTKAEVEDYRRLRAMERRHVRLDPDGEREEIRQIFRAKGLEGEQLELVVETITSNETAWIGTMLAEEHGLAATPRSPTKAAWATFGAFFLCGLVPLLPYLFGGGLTESAVATGLVFFAIGSAKSHWSLSSWWRSGLETLAIGMGAALLAYGIGYWLFELYSTTIV